jgi:dihydroorotase
VLFDPDLPFVVDAEKLNSRARNTPFDGRKLQGRVRKTFVGGVCVYDREKEAAL